MNEETLELLKVCSEKINKNTFHIYGHVSIPRSSEQVWQVLTDYQTLPDFIPNLLITRCLPHPTSGIRLEHIGVKSFFNFRLSLRVVIDLVENCPDQIAFDMVEGDFRTLSGKCWLKPFSLHGTYLYYSVEVIPNLTIPLVLFNKLIQMDLPVNLLAISQRVQDIFPLS